MRSISGKNYMYARTRVYPCYCEGSRSVGVSFVCTLVLHRCHDHRHHRTITTSAVRFGFNHSTANAHVIEIYLNSPMLMNLSVIRTILNYLPNTLLMEAIINNLTRDLRPSCIRVECICTCDWYLLNLDCYRFCELIFQYGRVMHWRASAPVIIYYLPRAARKHLLKMYRIFNK